MFSSYLLGQFKKKCGLFKEYFGSCFCSVIKSLWLWTAAHQALLSSTLSQTLLKFLSIASVMLSNHLILCCPLLLLPLVFPSIRVFSSDQLFASGGQSIGASATASVHPMNIQGWFPLELTGLISWQSKGLSRIFYSTTIWKHQFFGASAFFNDPRKIF